MENRKIDNIGVFPQQILEEDQTDDNSSINNSDAIRSNNVKINISSENTV